MIKNTPTPAEFIHRTGSVLGKAPSVACPGASTCSPLKGAEMDGRNGGKGSGTRGSSNLPRHRGELVGERSHGCNGCPFLGGRPHIWYKQESWMKNLLMRSPVKIHFIVEGNSFENVRNTRFRGLTQQKRSMIS